MVHVLWWTETSVAMKWFTLHSFVWTLESDSTHIVEYSNRQHFIHDGMIKSLWYCKYGKEFRTQRLALYYVIYRFRGSITVNNKDWFDWSNLMMARQLLLCLPGTSGHFAHWIVYMSRSWDLIDSQRKDNSCWLNSLNVWHGWTIEKNSFSVLDKPVQWTLWTAPASPVQLCIRNWVSMCGELIVNTGQLGPPWFERVMQ